MINPLQNHQTMFYADFHIQCNIGHGNILSMVRILADGTWTCNLYTYLIHIYIQINTNIVID